MTDIDDPLLTLPVSLRDELKPPFGPLETDANDLLERVGRPIIAVGDVVTYHLHEAGCTPAVAVVDGKTKREVLAEEMVAAVTKGATLEATNPPGTITASLLTALNRGLESSTPVTIVVDGEEDLAALPAIVAAPDGATVIYGQPDEGMVYVEVDEAIRSRVKQLLAQFEGDTDRAWEILECSEQTG